MSDTKKRKYISDGIMKVLDKEGSSMQDNAVPISNNSENLDNSIVSNRPQKDHGEKLDATKPDLEKTTGSDGIVFATHSDSSEHKLSANDDSLSNNTSEDEWDNSDAENSQICSDEWSNSDDSSVDLTTKHCDGCQKRKSLENFSNKQRKKRNGGLCTSCVAYNQEVDRYNATQRKQARQYQPWMCNSCNQMKQRKDFYRITTHKCKSCDTEYLPMVRKSKKESWNRKDFQKKKFGRSF